MNVSLSYKEKLRFFIAKATEITSYLFIGIVLFYVLFFVAKKSFVLITDKHGITSIEWLTFSGSLIASMLGAIGGFMAAKTQLAWNRDIQVKRLKKYLYSILYYEVKLNNDEFYNYYWGKDKVEMDRAFRLTDWEKIKSELYVLDTEIENSELVKKLCELYSWLERMNQFVNMKINLNESGRYNLYRNIKECLHSTLSEYNSMQNMKSPW